MVGWVCFEAFCGLGLFYLEVVGSEAGSFEALPSRCFRFDPGVGVG